MRNLSDIFYNRKLRLRVDFDSCIYLFGNSVSEVNVKSKKCDIDCETEFQDGI
jgi:hypothetical protein